MGVKWFWGLIILSIISILFSLFGPWNAKARSVHMGDDIRAALAGNYGFSKVDMNGNVATLTGVAPSDAAANQAATIAGRTECSKCLGKKPWHVIENKLTVNTSVVQALPLQAPYTFEGIKGADGSIALNGYVASDIDRKTVLDHARGVFSDTTINDSLKLATGQPNANWLDMIKANIEELNILDQGRFVMEDASSFLTGQGATVAIRDRINDFSAGLSGNYGFDGSANVSVPNVAADNVGEVKSQTVCQILFDALKGDNKVNFESAKAEIRGAPSFDLLNNMASAAQQCASLRINIAGHTDSAGQDEDNQLLSEARANTVMAHLIANGVDRNRISAIGYGETRPIGDNGTPEGRATNRRIEFKVTQSE